MEALPVPDVRTYKPQRRRRWVPLSLRLFVVMLILLGTVGALWVGVPAFRRLPAIREIERLKGSVESVSVWPNWMRDLVGTRQIALFEPITVVNLHGCQEASDATVRELRGLTELNELLLGGTGITDAGLANVRAMKKLKNLQIYRTQITDAGLTCLQDLTELEGLDLAETKVTSAGIAHLQRLTRLRALNLEGTQLDDKGIRALVALVSLEDLHLTRTAVTGAGLKNLAGLRKLAWLWAEEIAVTDKDLLTLAELPSLKNVVLGHGHEVTDEGVAELQRLLPGVIVNRPPDPRGQTGFWHDAQ